MARKLVVQVVGETAGLTRSFQKASTEATRFSTSVTRSFSGLTRSIVTTTAAFAGFAGAAALLRDSFTAAEDNTKAQRSLAQQLAVSGAKYGQWRKQIEASGLGLQKFGFNVTEAQQSLTVLDRATGNVQVALKLQGVTADIARAKNKTLAEAALIVGKAYDGQLTSLRRLGVAIPKHATTMEALTLVAQAFSGQAKQNTTDLDKFHAALYNTELIIGKTLLPTINRLLTRLTDWLDKMNKSGKLQRDLNRAIQISTEIIQTLAAAFKTLSDAVGGSKHAVELLLGAFLAFKTARVIGGIADAISAVRGIGTAADASAGSVRRLGGALSVVGLAAADIALGKKAFTQQAAAGDVGYYRGSPYVKGTQDFDIWAAGFAGKTGVIPVEGGRGTVDLNQLNAEGRQAYGLGLQAGIKNRFAQTAKGLFGAAGRPPAGTDVGAPFAGRGIPPMTAAAKSAVKKAAAQPRIHIPVNVSGTAVLPGIAAFGHTETQSLLGGFQAYVRQFGLRAQYQDPIGLQLAQARAQALGEPMRPILLKLRAAAERALKSHRLTTQAMIQAYDAIYNINQQLTSVSKGFSNDIAEAKAYSITRSGGVVINGGVHLHGVQDMAQLENQLEARAKARPKVRRGAR
jgi:hypothetical protein